MKFIDKLIGEAFSLFMLVVLCLTPALGSVFGIFLVEEYLGPKLKGLNNIRFVLGVVAAIAVAILQAIIYHFVGSRIIV